MSWSLSISEYLLTYRHLPLGLAESRRHRGFLIRVGWNNLHFGYSDCHPWPELGDANVDTLMIMLRDVQRELKPCGESLAAFRVTTSSSRWLQPLRQSLEYAILDFEARKNNLNLFRNLRIPRSHYLCHDLFDLEQQHLADIVSKRFQAIKIKLTSDLSRALLKLRELAQTWPQNLKLRLDSNGVFASEEAQVFWADLPILLRDQLEFWEDPISGRYGWERLKLMTEHRLARDRETVRPQDFSVLILKPAIQDALALSKISKHDLCITSYLDHPLGQITAAYVAAQLAEACQKNHQNRLRDCGLLSHSVYEESDFSKALQMDGPHLLVPQGLGFGFDQFLEKLEWQNLF